MWMGEFYLFVCLPFIRRCCPGVVAMVAVPALCSIQHNGLPCISLFIAVYEYQQNFLALYVLL